MKLIIASISLLCMIVPSKCTAVDWVCDDDGHGILKGTGTIGGSNNPKAKVLCTSLKTQTDNMIAAGVCSNVETEIRANILRNCGNTKLPDADISKENLAEALKCTLEQCDGSSGDPHPYDGWEIKMKECLQSQNDDSTAAENCLSKNPIKEVCHDNGDMECTKFNERFDALKVNCKPPFDNDQSEKCKKEWKIGGKSQLEQLKDCFSTLQCTGKNTEKILEKKCLEECYEKTSPALDTCFTSEEPCENAPTTTSPTQTSTESSTESSATKASAQPGPNTASPAANNINPADQGQNGNKPTTAPASIQPQNDNDPTSAAPQDQDVTSDEDEGCMVRANQKIIIAFAATFVAINFLKALPVEN